MIQTCIKAIGQNIAMDCENPIIGGYTGRAVYIPINAIDNINGDDIAEFTVGENEVTGEINLKDGAHTVVIDNVFVQPFSGSTNTGNTDTGKKLIRKQLTVRIPLRGGEVSCYLVDPLLQATDGGLLVVEKKQNEEKSKYEVIGLLNGARVDPTSYTRNEYENGGDQVVTFVSDERLAEVSYNPAGSLDGNIAAFEELLSQGVNA